MNARWFALLCLSTWEKFSVSDDRRTSRIRGYEAASSLSVRRHPYSVILLDEMERLILKCLQHLAAGFGRRSPDGRSRVEVVSFKNIIIMTSNVGSQLRAGAGEGAYRRVQEAGHGRQLLPALSS